MNCRSKKSIKGTVGIAAAFMLLAGCGGSDIQSRTEDTEKDDALQLQQNIEEQDRAEAGSEEQPAQSGQSVQQGQAEEQGQSGQQDQSGQPAQSGQQGQSKQAERSDRQGQPSQQLPGGESGGRLPGRLDAGRILEEQSFQVKLNDWGEVRFVSYEPDHTGENPLEDVTFYLLRGEEILYQFPYIGTEDTSDYGMYYDVKFVVFTDTNADGKEDVVIGAEYMTGAGPQGAIPHVVVRIYEDYGDHFTYNEGFSDKINDYLPWESNVLAKDVKRLIQLTGGNGQLTDYESYSGKWRVSTGYVAAYEETAPVSRNELTCQITNGNEFSGSLFTEQGMTQRIASVDEITGTIQNGELFYDFTDDGWGGTGTLHIMFLPNQINVDVLNHQMAEENASGYGISGMYEMKIRE